MSNLYSDSKKTTRVWDGNKLGLMKCSSEMFLSNFFENKNLCALVTYDINMDAQHLFCPALYDRILQDDVDEAATVVGNAVDIIGQLMPMKTPKAVLNHIPVIMPKERVHPTYDTATPLPKMHLKGTTWEKEDNQFVIFLVPVAMPLPFGIKIPYGNLADPEYTRSVKALGSEYEYHAEAIYVSMANHQDIDKVVRSITSKGQEDNYLPGYGTGVICNKVPYIQLSLFRDPQECPGAMEDLSLVFAPKKVESAAVNPSSAPLQALPPQTFVLAKPEDDEKKKVEEMTLNRLSLFFASDNDFSLDRGSNFENGLSKPEWSDSFQEILEMKGETRTTSFVDLVENIFASMVGVELDIFSEKSAVTDAASFIFLPKNAASQFLKGNFSTENIGSNMKEKCDVTLATYLYQENSNNKVVLMKEREIRAQAEADYDVPENQRSKVDSMITVPGSLVNYQHVVGLVANCIKIWSNLVQKAFKKGDLMPVIVSCFMAIFACLTDPTNKRWVKDHEASAPHFIIWLWNVLQGIYICAAKATRIPSNMSLCRKGQFEMIDKGLYKQMIFITKNAIDK